MHLPELQLAGTFGRRTARACATGRAEPKSASSPRTVSAKEPGPARVRRFLLPGVDDVGRRAERVRQSLDCVSPLDVAHPLRRE